MQKRWIGPYGWTGLCALVCLGLVAGCPSATGGGGDDDGGEGEYEPDAVAGEVTYGEKLHRVSRHARRRRRDPGGPCRPSRGGHREAGATGDAHPRG